MCARALRCASVRGWACAARAHLQPSISACARGRVPVGPVGVQRGCMSALAGLPCLWEGMSGATFVVPECV